MNESYVECLVKTRPNLFLKFLKILLIMLTVVFFIIGMGMYIWPALIVALVTGVGTYFVWLHSDIEYEYLYVDRELTIDKVFVKSRRKRVGSYSMERMEVVAPFRSHHLDGYKHRQCKVKDYSIGVQEQPDQRYAIYYEGNLKIIISPSPELIKALKNSAPRKVFTD